MTGKLCPILWEFSGHISLESNHSCADLTTVLTEIDGNFAIYEVKETSLCVTESPNALVIGFPK